MIDSGFIELKIKLGKLSVDIDRVLETSLAIGLVAGLGIGAFLIGQRYFSVFSYQGMTRDQIMQVMKRVDDNSTLISRACGDGFCRGIYLNNGQMLYYNLKDKPGEGGKTDLQLYNVPSELWTTDKSLFHGMGGRFVTAGVNKQNLPPPPPETIAIGTDGFGY